VLGTKFNKRAIRFGTMGVCSDMIEFFLYETLAFVRSFFFDLGDKLDFVNPLFDLRPHFKKK
jgi:hypothetical protein